LKKTPQRIKLLDTFLAFLVVVGALQFLYCLIVGNFVRSSFLSPPSTIASIVSGSANGGVKHTSLYTRSYEGLANTLHSPSTPSSQASVQQSANLSSPSRSASRRTPRTRPISRAFRTSVRLRISCWDRCCCISSASTSSTNGDGIKRADAWDIRWAVISRRACGLERKSWKVGRFGRSGGKDFVCYTFNIVGRNGESIYGRSCLLAIRCYAMQSANAACRR